MAELEVVDKSRAVEALSDGQPHRFLFVPEAPIFTERRAAQAGHSFEEMISGLERIHIGVGREEQLGGVCKVIEGELVVVYTPEAIRVPLGEDFEKALETYGVAFVECLVEY